MDDHRLDSLPAGSGARRSGGSNKDVIIEGRLNEDDVVWVLTKERGWRLGHIQPTKLQREKIVGRGRGKRGGNTTVVEEREEEEEEEEEEKKEEASIPTTILSIEHVAVHLLTTDPRRKKEKHMLHVRKYDQLRRVHPNLLSNRQTLVSPRYIVTLLAADSHGARTDISEELASDACLSLGDLARSSERRMMLLQINNIIQTIVATLQSFNTDRNVQHSCILALGNLAQADTETIKMFKNAQTKEMIANAMEILPHSSDIVSASCVAFGNIAAAEHVFPGFATTKIKVSVKAVELALKGMKEHDQVALVQTRCAFAIGAICRSSASLQRSATDIMGVDTLLSAMMNHPNDSNVQWRLAFAITNVLSLNPIGRKTFGERSVVLLLANAKKFFNDKRIQLWTCRALYQLIMKNNKNRDVALASDGITIVLEIQKLYASDQEIAMASERVIDLLWEF